MDCFLETGKGNAPLTDALPRNTSPMGKPINGGASEQTPPPGEGGSGSEGLPRAEGKPPPRLLRRPACLGKRSGSEEPGKANLGSGATELHRDHAGITENPLRRRKKRSVLRIPLKKAIMQQRAAPGRNPASIGKPEEPWMTNAEANCFTKRPNHCSDAMMRKNRSAR